MPDQPPSTQPYPTADAYEKVCAARNKWQARAEALEGENERLREAHSAILGLAVAALSRVFGGREGARP